MEKIFKRQKCLTIIVLPIIPLIWIIGWTLTNFSSPKPNTNQKQKVPHKEAQIMDKLDSKKEALKILIGDNIKYLHA